MINLLIELESTITDLEEQIERVTEVRDPLLEELYHTGIEIRRQFSGTPEHNGYFYLVEEEKHGIFPTLLECLQDIKENHHDKL